MKMRKLFAGIVAAATLLSGMAFGVASAQAVDQTDDQAADQVAGQTTEQTADADTGFAADIKFGHTITMHSDNYNRFKKADGSLRDYAYVKIADYVSDGHTGVTLQTVDALKGEIAQSLMAWQPGYNPQSGDPLVWLSEQGKDDNSLYRKFVDAMDASLRPTATKFNSGNTAPSAALDSYFNTVTFDFGTDKGLYLIFDLSGDQTFATAGGSTETIHQMNTVMVGTSIEGAVVQPDNADGKIEAKGDETPNSQFEFVKKNRDGDTLSGAEFEIKYDSGELKGQLVYFQKTEPYYQALDYQKNEDGSYIKVGDVKFCPPYPATDGTDGPNKDKFCPPSGTNRVISDQNGEISVKNLQPGWYTVTEVKAPTGYTDKYLPSFKIMVNNQGIVSSYIGKDDGDPNDLVVDQGGLTVINLRPTELPKTGAEGIALFFVIAALLGGAGVTVFLKSRKTKSMLNA
ncbi:SpaA isopeptide-forming pilin-related protein [Bifidobacterium sp. UTBIF-78]|uniref:SpaA isopeptide-forming pilin-related protein n=1 Tax=Bifidobacterium sp. UTBIF-78 TaxID=1465263 RepID=UPI00112886AB|nr:SpaA isopeptide-forming pilin-related protein [Bifidobacterium sp. UTBIF-78]TPF92511.1 hypothetical protein BG22_09215 [Bifidobacterium sp. UTBIF-78]